MPRRLRFFIGLTLLALIGALVAERLAGGTPAPIPIGADTTFLTEPVTAQGTIDYVGAVETAAAEGVTEPENIAASLVRTVGRGAFTPEAEGYLCRALGVAPESLAGVPFQPLALFLREQAFARGEFDLSNPPPLSRFDRWLQQPWTARDAPDVAAWIERHADALTHLEEAATRSRYFVPFESRREIAAGATIDAASLLFAADPLAGQHGFRATELLVARAMLRLGEEQPRAALGDLSTAWRLLHVAAAESDHWSTSNACVIALQDVLSGFATAVNADGLPAEEWIDVRDRLREVPRASDLAVRMSRLSRLTLLDLLTRFQLRGSTEFWGDVGLPNADSHRRYDLAEVARLVNQIEDNFEATCRIPVGIERRREQVALTDDIADRIHDASAAAPGPVAEVLFAPAADPLLLLDEITWYEQHLITGDLLLAADRVVLDVALSVAAFRSASGRLPGSLADLVPPYLDAIPNDPLDGTPLRYVVADGSALVYSVGYDLTDEDGRGVHVDRVQDYLDSAALPDDIAIRVGPPAATLKSRPPVRAGRPELPSTVEQ